MEKDQVREYFSDNALMWEKHYEGGGPLLKIFNKFFRKGLKERWDATMSYSSPAEGRTFLDIGCGAGNYSIALARAGAEKVTGVDFAPGMIEVCKQRAEETGVQDRCEFLIGDFMEMDFIDKFDVVFAMGVFDYVKDYPALWKRMAEVSKGVILGSFPGHTWPREPVRKFRYNLKNLPVYFYDRAQVEELCKTAGLKDAKIHDLSAGYVLAGFVEE